MEKAVPKKVLITDDDPAMQDAFRLVFERAGYAVAVLTSGNAILENNYELPDIYILDKQLSGIDGLDVCRFLKTEERTRHIPVIIISATPHVARLASDAYADDFLEKPFSNRALVDMVEKYITA